MKALRIIGWVIVGLVGIAVIGLLVGIVIQLLWNWLMPAIFGLPEITYWQGVGIFILFKILFGAHHPHHKKNGAPHPGQRFAERVRDRMSWHCGGESSEDGRIAGDGQATQR